MPEKFFKYTDLVFNQKKFDDMCFEASKIILDNEISENELKNIVYDAFNFPAPVKHRITSYNVCYTKLLRLQHLLKELSTTLDSTRSL